MTCLPSDHQLKPCWRSFPPTAVPLWGSTCCSLCSSSWPSYPQVRWWLITWVHSSESCWEGQTRPWNQSLQIHNPNRMTTGEDGRETIPSPLAECWMASHSALSLLCSLGCLGEAQWPISRQVDWKGLDSVSIYRYIYSVGQKQMDRDLSTGFSAVGASWGTLSCRFASWRNWQISIIISTALIMGEV